MRVTEEGSWEVSKLEELVGKIPHKYVAGKIFCNPDWCLRCQLESALAEQPRLTRDAISKVVLHAKRKNVSKRSSVLNKPRKSWSILLPHVRASYGIEFGCCGESGVPSVAILIGRSDLTAFVTCRCERDGQQPNRGGVSRFGVNWVTYGTPKRASLEERMNLPKKLDAKLSIAELACAMYEGMPHVQNLAEKTARNYGRAEALTFFYMMGSDVQNFWMGIAKQIIDHSKEWEKNQGSACVLSERESKRLAELPRVVEE